MTERTDRELLEMAAKAAGVRLEWDGPMELWQPMYYEGKTYHAWDPLLDDGDALRLAVNLGITPHQYSTCVSAKRSRGDGIDCEEDFSGNPCAATRRAIVRAASQMAEGEEHG